MHIIETKTFMLEGKATLAPEHQHKWSSPLALIGRAMIKAQNKDEAVGNFFKSNSRFDSKGTYTLEVLEVVGTSETKTNTHPDEM